MTRLLALLLLAGCASVKGPVVQVPVVQVPVVQVPVVQVPVVQVPVVQVLVVQGCPGREGTVGRVQSVARDMGIQIQLSEMVVSTREEAVGSKLLGSPTVLVNGLDIEPAARFRADYAIACRMYQGQRLPPRAMVQQALAEASGEH